MIYTIAGGVPKDILVNDQVVLSKDQMDDLGNEINPDGSYGYKVLGFDSAGTNIQVRIGGVTTWLTASQVSSVWRKV